MDNADITAIMPEENIYQVAYPSTVKIVNGQLVYIMLDISKPVNTFLDLRQYFNGGQGDHGNVLPLMFAQNGRPLNTAGYTVKMRGAYPDGTAFELTADQSGSGNAIFNFNFLPGFFQTVGRYTFQIELDNGTNKLSSKVCFFDVEPNLLSVAMDFVDGVSPFDNEYEEWKAKVQREINQLTEEITTLMATASDCKALLNQYIKSAQAFVDAAVAKALADVPKLDGNNTFTGTNTFSGSVHGKNISADSFNGNFYGGQLNGNALNILGTASLPEGTMIGDVDTRTIPHMALQPGYSTMLMNATANDNDPAQWNKSWWLWTAEMATGVEYPYYVIHMTLNIDSADVGKPIAQFPKDNYFKSGRSHAWVLVANGSIALTIDENNVLHLDDVKGVSGKIWVDTTAIIA